MPTRFFASGRPSSSAGSSGQRLRVGLRLADLLRDRVVAVGQVDPAHVRRVGLGHLRRAVAQAHDPRRGAAADIRLGRDEQLDVEVGVELDRDVARQLDMLLLVLADRHVGRLVEQDVGRLEHRIGEQADATRPRGSCRTSP